MKSDELSPLQRQVLARAGLKYAFDAAAELADLAKSEKTGATFTFDDLLAIATKACQAGIDSVTKAKDRKATDSPLDPEIIAGNGKEDVRAADRAISARSSFANRWPDIVGIKSVEPLAKPKKRAPVSAASEKSFAERYPHVAGMKVWSR